MTDHETLLLQLHSDVERVKNQIESLIEKVETVVDVIGQQSAIIRGFEDERQRRIGSRTTIKLLWGIIAAGLTSIAYNLHDIMQWLFPPKGH